jgi:hypothetical protein
MFKKTWCFCFKGRGMTLALSIGPLTAEVLIRSQVSQYGIYGERRTLRDVSRRVYQHDHVSTIT